MSESTQVKDGVLVFDGGFSGGVEGAGSAIQAAISGYCKANPQIPTPIDGVDVKLNPAGHFTVAIKVRTTLPEARSIRDGIGQALRSQGLDLGDNNELEYS